MEASLDAKGDHGVDARSATRRKEAGESGDACKKESDDKEAEWIERMNMKKQAAQVAGERERRGNTEGEAEQNELHPLRKDQSEHVPGVSTKGYANADFVFTTADKVRASAANSARRKSSKRWRAMEWETRSSRRVTP